MNLLYEVAGDSLNVDHLIEEMELDVVKYIATEQMGSTITVVLVSELKKEEFEEFVQDLELEYCEVGDDE